MKYTNIIKHMKRYSISLIIGKVQIKILITYYNAFENGLKWIQPKIYIYIYIYTLTIANYKRWQECEGTEFPCTLGVAYEWLVNVTLENWLYLHELSISTT